VLPSLQNTVVTWHAYQSVVIKKGAIPTEQKLSWYKWMRSLSVTQYVHDYANYQKHKLKIKTYRLLLVLLQFCPSANHTFGHNLQWNILSISLMFFNFMLSCHSWMCRWPSCPVSVQLVLRFFGLDMPHYFHLYLNNIKPRPILLTCTSTVSVLFPDHFKSNMAKCNEIFK
jgi:hypothetical protein